MRKSEMPTSIRLTKDEQKLIHDKTIEVNKKLMAQNRMPLKESELIHEILMAAGKVVTVNTKGEIDFTE